MRPKYQPWHVFWRVARTLLLLMVDLYAVALALYLLLRALYGEALWPVVLVSAFLAWALLPTLALFPLMLWRRRWPTAALLGVSAAIFAWLYGPLFLPQMDAPVVSSALTVMTINLDDYFPAPENVAHVLRTSGADVIGVQELTPEQATAMERGLADAYPYQMLYGFGASGKGLLSRFPFVEQEPFWMDTGRVNLRAVLDVDGAPLTVIVAHPPSRDLNRRGPRIDDLAYREINQLIRIVRDGGATVMLSDFNLTDQDTYYTLLTDARLIDAFRVAGWGFGFTWPVRREDVSLPPLARIDYIWYTPPLHALEAWVGPDAGSNHLPVLARLGWR